MAMTKAEKAELEKARQDLALVKALRFSGAVEPEKMPAPTSGDLVEGWLMNAHGVGSAEICTTTSASHWRGLPLARVQGAKDRWNLNASKNGLRLYRTKADALKALRLAKEREFAEALANIDRRISEAGQE